MATIAFPQFKGPKVDLGALLKSPAVGLAGAGVLFAGAVVALVQLLGPMGGGATHVRIPLDEPLRAAPAGWREALKPVHGEAHIYKDVVRLSERPLAPGAARRGRRRDRCSLADRNRRRLGGRADRWLLRAGPRWARCRSSPRTAARRPRPMRGPSPRTAGPRSRWSSAAWASTPRATRQAIETLRPEITLSFVVYAEGLQGWIDMARAHGHEVLLETPMEPLDYPDNDPGPYTLMADGQPPETVKKLEWILSRATG